jgi:hypothetical protein
VIIMAKNLWETIIVSVGMLMLVAVLLLAGCKVIPPVGPGTGNNGGTVGTGATGTVLTQGTFSQAQIFDPTKEITPTNFKTEKEFEDFVKSNAGSSYNYYGGGRGGVMYDLAMEKSISSVAPSAAGASGANAAVQVNAEEGGFSTTNNQVTGVDEGDIMKTDGSYIYTVTGNTVFIIKAYPGEDAEIVSTTLASNLPWLARSERISSLVAPAISTMMNGLPSRSEDSLTTISERPKTLSLVLIFSRVKSRSCWLIFS